jgi:hypothetical protein
MYKVKKNTMALKNAGYWVCLICACCSFLFLMLAVISKLFLKGFNFPFLVEIAVCFSMIASQIQIASLSYKSLFVNQNKK